MSNRQVEVKRTEGRATPSERSGMRWSYRPRVDLYDANDELILLADVPGADPDRIDVRFEDGTLRIHAYVEPRQPAETSFFDHEYGIGDFDRELEIGNIIDPERIDAEMDHGVLRLRMPKSEAARPRRIPVNTKK